MPRGGALPSAHPRRRSSRSRTAQHGSERRRMRQGRYVHSPPAVRRRRIVTVSPAATPGSRLAVDARRRRGDARHLHAIGPRGRRTIGPEAMLHRARARARGPAHRGDAAGRWRRAAIVVLAAPRRTRQDRAARACRAGGGPGRLPRAPGRAGPARAPFRVRRGARAAGGAAARRVRRASARGCSKGRPPRPAPCSSTAPCPARTPPWPSPTACCGCAPPWPTRRRSCSSSTTRTGPTGRRCEVLAYLARRIADLPLLIAVGARADDPDAAVGPAQPDRRGARGDGAAPPAADPSRRGAAHPPRGAVRAARGLPRLPSRGGRQPVAAGRARPPDRRPRRRARSTPPRATPPPHQRDRAHRRPRAPGRALAARPRRRRGARRDRRGRAAPGRRGRGRRRARRAAAPPATGWWPPGCSLAAARASRTTSSPARSATTCRAGAASACTARRRAR